MTPYFTEGGITLYVGDCLEVLPTLPAESVDAIVTDPPYHLTSGNAVYDVRTERDGRPRKHRPKGKAGGFMGKTWDGGDIAFRPEVWEAVLRVAKPGAHLLAFGGTRTSHRLVCAIEDAGWEIRDTLMWVYASGFPKSLDVSKAIDKEAGIWRGKAGDPVTANGSMSGPNYERSEKGAPATEAAKQWDGWGTALKPAVEPIVLARKPLVGTVAANVQRYGTGALNIDASRIALGQSEDVEQLNSRSGGRRGFASQYVGGTDHPLPPGCDLSKGRWPANLILSYPEDEYELRPNVSAEQVRELYRWLSENP